MGRSVVIVGAGLGGLSAAIYARLAGFDVLLLEQHAVVGGKAAGIEQDGFSLDPGPSIVILPEIYESVFRAAGRQSEDYLTFQRLDPFSRVYFENEGFLDLPADRCQCLELLQRQFPADAASFDELMRRLDQVAPKVRQSVFDHPYDQWWQLFDPRLAAVGVAFDLRSSYRQIVDRWFQSPLLRAFFYGFPSYGGQTYDAKAPGAFLIPYFMLEGGVYYPKGGVAAIPRALERLAREIGVEIQTGKAVTGFRSVGNRLTGVLSTDGVIEAEFVISNRDRLKTREWLGERVEWEPSFSYFTVHWGIRRKLAGLSHHTLLVPQQFVQSFEKLYGERRFPDPSIIYLNVTSETDSATAPEGMTNLFAVVTVPAQCGDVDWDRDAQLLAERIRGALRQYGLQFDQEDVVFERIQTPQYFEEAHGNYQGSLYGPDEKYRLFGLLPLRNYDEQFKNLFYCGGSVQPGAGMPMAVLSGRFAVERLTRRNPST